jgi:hypothetical protein
VHRLLSSLALLALVGNATPAHAQAAPIDPSWVSGVGDDANPCSRTAPCKTFAGAMAATTAGGEIAALDPGGYGPVTVTFSVTIDGRGTHGSILAAGTNGIVINAGDGDVVTLRNLSLNGAGTGHTGILITNAGSVHIEDSNIFGFTQQAIDCRPAVGKSTTLYLKNVVVASNNNSNNAGMYSGGVIVGTGANLVVARSYFFNDVVGLKVAGGTASIHDSVFSGNSSVGLWVSTGQASMDHGLVSANGVGVQGDALVRLSEVMTAHNATGLAGANVVSFGNNRIQAGNGTDGMPTMTLPQQ